MVAILLLFFAQAQGRSDLAVTAQRAQQYMAAGRYREAIPLCKELLEAAPKNAVLLMNLGVAQQMTGDYEGAAESLASAVKLDGRLFPANLYLGFAEMTLGHPQSAIQPFRRALELKPDTPGVRQALADALFQAGQLDEAAAQFETVTGADPRNAHAWYTLGRTLVALARNDYEKLLGSVPPDSAFALAVKADGLLRHEQYRRAFAIFNEALSKDPDLVSARLAIAHIYEVAGHADWAAEEKVRTGQLDCTVHKMECDFAQSRYEAVLAATEHRETASDLYWRAQAYTELSSQAFAKLEQLPPSEEMYMHRAGVEYDAGRARQVVEDLQKALELAPQDRALQHELAMALGAAREYDAAYKLALELLGDEPDSPELNALAGDALLHQQKAEAALPYLVKSLAKDPYNPVTHRSLGLAYMQSGSPKLALPHLEMAVALDTDGSLNYQLASAYRQTGEAELSRKAMARYRELSAQAAVSPEPEITAPQ